MVEIAPQVFELRTRGANAFLLVDEELTLIDAGLWGTATLLADFLPRISRSPHEVTRILLTHQHWDHTGGLVRLKKLTNAQVAIHKADRDFLAAPFSPSLLSHPTLSNLNKKIFNPPTEAFDTLLEGGEVLPLMGGLEVIHTPGHTPGSICFYSRQRSLLIVGDALHHRWGRLNLPAKVYTVNPAQAEESVKKLARLAFQVLCFGHGRAITQEAQESVAGLI